MRLSQINLESLWRISLAEIRKLCVYDPFSSCHNKSYYVHFPFHIWRQLTVFNNACVRFGKIQIDSQCWWNGVFPLDRYLVLRKLARIYIGDVYRFYSRNIVRYRSTIPTDPTETDRWKTNNKKEEENRVMVPLSSTNLFVWWLFVVAI